MTLDGFIAKSKDHCSTEWNSDADKAWFRQKTKEAGVIVMGTNTFNTIGKPLPGRLTIVYSREPKPTENPEQLRYTKLSPPELLKQLQDEGYSNVAICGGSTIYTLFMQAGVVNNMYITLEPKLFGKGIGLFNDDITQTVELQETTPLSPQTLLLQYGVR